LREELDALFLSLTSALDSLWPAPAPVSVTRSGLAAGTRVADRYLLKKVLGEGAYGRVWRATDTTTDLDVAFKELRAPAEGEGFLEAAQSVEFSTLSRLRHPNIVRVIDTGAMDAVTRFIVMELVPGSDVAGLLKSGPLAASLVWSVLEDLLSALELLHSRHFVHGDIKSDNVRLTESGHAKVMDFGLLLPLGQPSSTVQGTPQYMAPEIFKGAVIDGRTDLYATGVLAYEMFTGSVPFDGSSLRELAEKHLREAPRAPSYFLDLPAGVDDIVMRLLAKEPSARYPDAGSVLDDIARVSGRQRVAAQVTQQTSYLYAADLIGRDIERARIDDALAALAPGKGQSLLFAGGRGAGKTRLLDELALRAKIERLCVARAACRSVGQTPLEPIAAALDSVVSFTDEETLAKHGPMLAHLLSAVRARGQERAPVPDPMEAKVRLYGAVVAWLQAVAQRTHIVIIIDDLQWADGASLDLYNHLVRSLSGEPVLFASTLGSDDSDGLGPVLASVHERRTERIDLAPLTRTHLQQLLDDTLQAHDLDDGFVAALAENTAGNPFFAIETLRLLIEDGRLERRAGRFALTREAVRLPTSVRETVMGRLATFSADLREATQLLSVHGLEIDLDIAAQHLGVPRTAVEARAEELLERQVWKRIGRRLLFAQEVSRAAIVETLSENERQSAHDRLGTILSSMTDKAKAPPALLAHHFKRGHEPRRAVPHFIAGARDAVGAQQPIEATKLLSEASALLSDEPRDRDLSIAVYDLLASISARAHPPSCVMAVDRLATIWGREIDLDRTALRVRARNRMSARLPEIVARRLRIDMVQGEFSTTTHDATRIFFRLLEHQTQQAVNLATMGMIDRALANVADIARRVPDPQSPLLLFTVIAELLALGHTGRSARAMEVARALQARFSSSTPPPPHLSFPCFWSFYGFAMAEALSGRALSVDVMARLDEIAQRSGRMQDRAFALLPRFVEACHRGDPGSTEVAREMEDICYRLAYPQPISSRLRLWHPVYLIESGELERADAATRSIAVFAAATRDGWLETYAAIYRGQIALARREFALATHELTTAVDAARAKNLGRLTLALVSLAEARAALGDHDGARAAVDEALARATSADVGAPYDEVVSTRAKGALVGDVEGGALVARARELARRIGNPIQEAFCELELGRLLSDDAALGRAHSIFVRLENPRGQEQVVRAREECRP
jgi:hypothetical protein